MTTHDGAPSSSPSPPPHEPLPRDTTGRYLHLRLKRFPSSANDKLMPFARKQRLQIPHDAEIDMTPRAGSACRWCRSPISKGQVRAKLYLQCHKGTKNAAYFHVGELSDGSSGDGNENKDKPHPLGCFWEYPEFHKLDSIEELVGLEELSPDIQQRVKERFAKAKQDDNQEDEHMHSSVNDPGRKESISEETTTDDEEEAGGDTETTTTSSEVAKSPTTKKRPPTSRPARACKKQSHGNKAIPLQTL